MAFVGTHSAMFLGCLLLIVKGVFSQTDGTIYGMQQDGGNAQFVTLNAGTGQTTPLGGPLPTIILYQGVGSIDTFNKTFFYVGINTTARVQFLIGLSLETGQEVSSLQLPYELAGPGGYSCNVDPNTGYVYTTGLILDAMFLLRINPYMNMYQTLTDLPGITLTGAPSTFDYVNSIIWEQLANDTTPSLWGTNSNTGAIVFQLGNQYNMQTLNFDSNKGLVFGVGTQVTDKGDVTMILVTLSSSSGAMNVVGSLPGYSNLNSAISAIDSKQRLLYVFMSPNGEKQTNVVTINIDSAKVTNSVACPGSCVFSVGVYNSFNSFNYPKKHL